jgi:uncharacterized membrane protein YfcA
MELSFAIAGFFVGAVVGVTGVGGGSLMTPILVMVFQVPAGMAVGTDLLFAAITKGVGTALHGLNQSVSWKVVARLSAGSIPAALATLWAAHHFIDQTKLAGIMTLTLGWALILTSIAMLLQPLYRKLIRKEPPRNHSTFPAGPSGSIEEQRMLAEEAANESRPEAAALTIFVGFILGTLVTLTSVGAGALGVMVLMALYPKVRSVRIVGTDIAHAVPLTLVAGLGHASLGVVNYSILGSLLLGSIPGIALGSHLAFRLPERALKRALAVILMYVGSKLVLG